MELNLKGKTAEMRFRHFGLGLTAMFVLGAVAAQARPFNTSVSALLVQDTEQKCDITEVSFDLPTNWTAFNMELPDAKDRIAAKLADGSISDDSAKNCLNFADKPQYKLFAYAPKTDAPMPTSLNVVIEKEEGNMVDQQASLVKDSTDKGLTVIKNEMTEHYLRYSKKIEKDVATPYVVDQVLFKPGETIYLLTFGYPVTDVDAMDPVVEKAAKSFTIK